MFQRAHKRTAIRFLLCIHCTSILNSGSFELNSIGVPQFCESPKSTRFAPINTDMRWGGKVLEPPSIGDPILKQVVYFYRWGIWGNNRGQDRDYWQQRLMPFPGVQSTQCERGADQSMVTSQDFPLSKGTGHFSLHSLNISQTQGSILSLPS